MSLVPGECLTAWASQKQRGLESPSATPRLQHCLATGSLPRQPGPPWLPWDAGAPGITVGFSAPLRVPPVCDGLLGCYGECGFIPRDAITGCNSNPFADVYLNLNPFIKTDQLIEASECSLFMKLACL